MPTMPFPDDDLSMCSDADLPWERLSGQKIVVSGATGMIGSLLTHTLLKHMDEVDFELYAISRSSETLNTIFENVNDPRFHKVQADVNDPLDLKSTTVFHCASNTHPRQYGSDPIGTLCSNVIGTKNLLDTMVPSQNGRFVFLSSVEIYGENRGDVSDFKEDYCGYLDCNTLRAGYNEGKRAGEALCQAYRAQRSIDVVIPRISRTYGPSLRRNDSKAMSQFLFNGANRENIVLKSAGTQTYSYCYSADAVRGVLHCFFFGRSGEAYNIAGLDSDISLKDLAGMISAYCGTEVTFEIPDKQEAKGYSTATRATLDISKIKEIGWEPRIPLKQGIGRTVDWLKKDNKISSASN